MATTRRLDYERVKQAAAARSREASRLGRDIGDIPPILDVKLRRECDRYFQAFLEAMFPHRFPIPWSKNHLKLIALTEDTIRTGGRVAVAMPRGEGKTTIAECGGIWAAVTALHRFIMLIGATKPNADSILENIQTELAHNERLLATYPAVCYPFAALQGEARRAAGQLHHGEQTHIVWSQDEIRFATIRGERASGAIIQTAGIEGNIRGRRVGTIRPTLAILDDIQTDESAWSESQCESRRKTIEGSVAGLAGPGQGMAMIMPCTVIRRGDLADTILDRDLNPQWRGLRTRMLESFPTNDDLWQKYAELRTRSLLEREDISLATEFYRKNRAKMDAGAVAAWTERFNKATELSAVQHAMNLKLADEVAFWAERQNQPLDESAGDEAQLTPAQIVKRTSGLKRGIIPMDAQHLTAGVDVQGKMLYWGVAAWGEDFRGSIIDYGTYPDQKRRYFTLREAKIPLEKFHAGGLEAQLYGGLIALIADLCGREWLREDGSPARIDQLLIDANWGPSTEVVKQACRASPFAAQLLPSHGTYYGASKKPLAERKRQKGDRVGINWFIPAAKGAKVRHVVFDTNWWKTFLAGRLRSPMGGAGALSLYGSKPDEHRMLAEHLTSERAVLTEGRSRKLEEWQMKRVGQDNHLWDVFVMTAVAASIRGAALPDQEQPGAVRRKRVKLSEIGRPKA